MGVYPRPLYVIGCSKEKRKRRCEAGLMYLGDLFKKAMKLACKDSDATAAPLILSAKHHVLETHWTIEPYNLSLSDLTKEERKAWAARVRECFPFRNDFKHWRVIFLAGALYREGIEDWMRERGAIVETPLAGLDIGQQKQWLNRALRIVEKGSLWPDESAKIFASKEERAE